MQPTNQQNPPTKQTEEDNNNKNIHDGNWQYPTGIDDKLKQIETNIEEGCAEAAKLSAEAVNNAIEKITKASSIMQPEKDEINELRQHKPPTPIVPELTTIYDSGATSSCGRKGDPFLATGKIGQNISDAQRLQVTSERPQTT